MLKKFERQHIYPLIAPKDEHSPFGYIQFPLIDSHGVDLVYAADGKGWRLRDVDVEGLGLKREDALKVAIENLRKWKDEGDLGEITEGNQRPGVSPFVMFMDGWLSAACLLLPELWNMVRPEFDTDDLCVLIPHRDALFIFPSKSKKQTADFILEKEEEDSVHPISKRVFRFKPNPEETLFLNQPPIEPQGGDI